MNDTTRQPHAPESTAAAGKAAALSGIGEAGGSAKGLPAERLSYAPVAVKSSRRAYWGAMGRRWARDTFSREQLISSLKSLAWVAPLTVLIWIYAEREQLAELAAYPISVQVKITDPRKVVTLLSPSDAQVLVELSGPRAGLDVVQDRID